MTQVRAPERVQSLGAGPATTPWDVARERLANPDESWTNWLATTRPDGRPHLMPVIAVWVDDAFHFIAAASTRKARNLAENDRCVIALSSRTLPSMDIVVEGRAEPLSDPDEVLRMADVFRSNNWPLDVRGSEVFGPNAPSAGPPPYRIFRMVPSKAFGLPGTYGMDKFDPNDLPKPTRWDFSGS
jgi:Pyridoxamine 5'-phosphate oxidase